MYRFLFRPKWIAFHLLCLGAVFLMISLGLWQLRRLDERKEFNAEVAERSELPPVSIDELLAEPGFTPEDATWRRVTAAGVWLPQQVTVFNRSQDGLAGDNVVTALEQDNGTTVLVNRGFVPLGVDQPPPPSGDVTIIGTVREHAGPTTRRTHRHRPRPHRGPADRPRPTRPAVPGRRSLPCISI